MAAQKQILEEIRDIIGGDASNDDDVLELTEIIEGDEAVETKPADLFKDDLSKPAKLDEIEPTDVLSEIDALLSDEKKEPAKPISAEGTEIELADFVKPELLETTEEIEASQEITPKENKMENNENLVSPKAADEAAQALQTLMTVANNVSAPKVQSAPFRNGDTVEDLVMTMLKPILKEWLDSNLPALVQSIVEKEIKRLVPKE